MAARVARSSVVYSEQILTASINNIIWLLCIYKIVPVRSRGSNCSPCSLYSAAPDCSSGLPNPNGSLSSRMPSGLVHQDTGQNSKTINATEGRNANFSTAKCFSFSIASKSLSIGWGARVPCSTRPIAAVQGRATVQAEGHNLRGWRH